MGLFDFLKKKQPSSKPLSPETPAANIEEAIPAKNAELTDHSKKEITVQRVCIEDMQQFTCMPFAWNAEIQKVIGPSTQPYAFMDIVGSNLFAAQLALEQMNAYLLEANRHIYPAYRIIKIPVDKIVFTPSQNTSYSKIICTPYTYTKRISKFPASLFFNTAHGVDIDSTHGELFYDRNGNIGKAEIICWRKQRGFFFFYNTVNSELVLDRIETVAPRYANRDHTILYKNRNSYSNTKEN